ERDVVRLVALGRRARRHRDDRPVRRVGPRPRPHADVRVHRGQRRDPSEEALGKIAAASPRNPECKMANPLVELQKLGQSPWHDNIRRGLLTTGALKRMIDDGDITGLTSNPTIFEQAIAKSTDYDDAISRLVAENKSPDDIFDALSIEDIRQACDLFAATNARTGGIDGLSSIEVNPKFARDTEATVREARRLWK